MRSDILPGSIFPDYQLIFPIMHTLVVRKELISERPELAPAIYTDFSQAKNLAMQRYKSGSAVSWELVAEEAE